MWAAAREPCRRVCCLCLCDTSSFSSRGAFIDYDGWCRDDLPDVQYERAARAWPWGVGARPSPGSGSICCGRRPRSELCCLIKIWQTGTWKQKSLRYPAQRRLGVILLMQLLSTRCCTSRGSSNRQGAVPDVNSRCVGVRRAWQCQGQPIPGIRSSRDHLQPPHFARPRQRVSPRRASILQLLRFVE